MRPWAPDYKRAFYWALAVHMGILVMMIMQIDFPWDRNKPALSYAMQNVQVIQAQIVPEAALEKRTDQINESLRIEAEKQQQLALEQEQAQKRQEEAAQLALEKEKQVKAEQLAQEQKKKQEADALRVAELEKQKQAEIAKQKEAELAKQKEAELAKQKEAQAQAEAAKLTEQAKQQQLLAEQQAINTAQQAQLQQAILTEVERYTLMVKQKVMQNWLIQRGYEGLTTQLHVRVAPGGTVLDVQVIKKSGNEALDRSAVSAVYRASPLPVPTDPAVFESFRELRLILRPEDVLG